MPAVRRHTDHAMRRHLLEHLWQIIPGPHPKEVLSGIGEINGRRRIRRFLLLKVFENHVVCPCHPPRMIPPGQDIDPYQDTDADNDLP